MVLDGLTASSILSWTVGYGLSDLDGTCDPAWQLENSITDILLWRNMKTK